MEGARLLVSRVFLQVPQFAGPNNRRKRGYKMPNYNFHEVFRSQPLRFQQFACAVVSQKSGCTFQRFGPGPDGGADGLYASENGDMVLQAKCTSVRGRGLLGMLRREREKIAGKALSRYILVLSLNSVSWQQKEAIREMIPEIRDTNDIITGEDLNGFLERPEYAWIERAYPELWLSSANQLEEILSRTMSGELMKQSRVKIRRMEEEQKTFVATKIFQEALELLEQHQRVIISGEPGAGKTTHAECLANYYIKIKGYEELYFVNSLREIERILGEESGRKTVIVFDDFWGHNTFSESRIELNSERMMEELFQSLKFYPDVRLIFTTREFVLQQGLRRFTELDQVCGIRKVNLNLSTYSLAQKAEILYRHLEASDLEYSYVKEIFRRGEHIVRSPAYSPRSVTYYLQNSPVGEREPWEYAVDLQKYVAKPEAYFEKIFKLLSYGAKLICFLLVLSEEEIRVEKELKAGFMSLAEGCGLRGEKERYEDYLRELEGTFTEIRNSFDEDVLVLEFLNYSIRDFVRDYLNRNMAAFEPVLVERCIYFNHLYYLADELTVSDQGKKRILQRLMEERDQLKYTYVYNTEVDFWNYHMDAETYEYDAHKMWQLLLLYEKERDCELFAYLKSYCDRLISELNQNQLERYGRECLVNLIPRMCENGYVVEADKLLEPFFRNIRWSEEIRNMEYLRPCCPEEFEKFWDSHLEEIRRKLPRLMLGDIEYWMGELDGDDRIDEILTDAQSQMERYGLEYTRSFERLLYRAAERPVPRKRKPKMAAHETEGEESPFETEQRMFQEVRDSAKEWLIPEERYLTSGEIKGAQRAAGKDYRKGYLTRGKFTGQDFSIVMEFLEDLGRPPVDEETFYGKLKAYLLKDWDDESGKMTGRLARVLIERDIFYFTEKTLAGLREEKALASLPERLLAAGLLHRTGKWYSFWNRSFMSFIALEDFRAMGDAEKKRYYEEDFWELRYKGEENIWMKTLAKHDRDFRRYLAVPYFEAFLSEVGQAGSENEAQYVLEKMELKGLDMGSGWAQDRWRAIMHLSGALEILSDIDEDAVWDINSAFQSMLDLEPDSWDIYKTESEGHEYVEVHTLLRSQKGVHFLETSGCFEKASELLETMRRYLVQKPSGTR